MTHFPPPIVHEKRKKVLRLIGIVFSALMVALVVGILLLIVRSESAHDEASCPFTKRSERVVGDATILEESRSCVPEAEERRWTVLRAGKATEFGRKRLAKEQFAGDRASWRAEADAQGKITVELSIDGKKHTEFREVDAPAQ